MALVQVIGKPAKSTTFGDLADTYCHSVCSHFSDTCTRVDVIIDCYRKETIKSGIWNYHKTKGMKIKRLVDSRNV